MMLRLINRSGSLWSSSMYSRNKQRSGSCTGLLQVLNCSRVLPVAARRSSMNGWKSLFPAMFALTLCPHRISGIGGGGGVGAAEKRRTGNGAGRCSNAEGAGVMMGKWTADASSHADASSPVDAMPAMRLCKDEVRERNAFTHRQPSRL